MIVAVIPHRPQPFCRPPADMSRCTSHTAPHSRDMHRHYVQDRHRWTHTPAAQDTGLPPAVLKYWQSSKDLAICRLTTTAASGKPLPMGLPSVTMSGTTP